MTAAIKSRGRIRVVGLPGSRPVSEASAIHLDAAIGVRPAIWLDVSSMERLEKALR